MNTQKRLFVYVILFMLGKAYCFAQNPSPPKIKDQIEFDESVIEGKGKGFSGITVLKNRTKTGNLYSRQISFKEKIRESADEIPKVMIPYETAGD